MDAANKVAENINAGFDYLRDNAWPILFLIGMGYVVKTKSESSNAPALKHKSWVICVSTAFPLSLSYMNASHTIYLLHFALVLDVYFSGAPNNTPNRVRSLEEDMHRVRLAQQEEAEKLAKKAAKENKEKEREKKHKKNVSASASSLKKDGGDSMGRTSGYNPMDQSSGGTCSFRPGRKGATRGG